jgi:tetraacyldisaccharide 4'-kinase
LEHWLAGHWWQPRPSAVARALQPLAWVYAACLRVSRRNTPAPEPTPVPVLVVGNFVVGGAGKTPVVIALVQALRAAGWHPGVVSRGFGRRGDGVFEVLGNSLAQDAGDEPLLVRRRTDAPVWVARRRLRAVRALCARHPEVDVIVADDGLQHRALGRAGELVVFDERGAGNGLLLPAGPLREPLPATVPAGMSVLHSGQAPTRPLPGWHAERRFGTLLPLQAWWGGDTHQAVALMSLRSLPLLALAGIAAPEKFFAMLEAEGLTITRCPQPDHASYDTLPWPPGTTEVVTTEKDAVKLQPGRVGAVRVWVVGLDLVLPAGLVRDILALLGAAATVKPKP